MNSPANDWAALDRALSDLAASGSVEVREDGEWLAELATLHFELRVERKNPLVHLWSDERNLTRRILRVKETADDRIVLEVQRFGRAKPGRLEFLLTDSRAPPGASPANNSAPASRGSSRKNFPMLSWIRSPPRPIWKIPSPVPTFAALCTKLRTRGLC